MLFCFFFFLFNLLPVVYLNDNEVQQTLYWEAKRTQWVDSVGVCRAERKSLIKHFDMDKG